MTFDEWNSEEIGRRIKPKSKGIPIIEDGHKIYVFDIRQTYGKDYRVWNYNHFVDNSVLTYYQNNIGLVNGDNKTLYENFYDTFYEMSLKQIMNNYVTMSAYEVEFVAKTMTSLFLSKSNFNINNLPSIFEMLDDMEDDDILEYMQIANKETAILYNDFLEKASSLENIQNYIQINVLFQFKNDKLLNEEEKQNLLLRIEINTPFNNEVLNQIYDGYVKRYEHTFKRNITNSIDKREILPQRDNEDTTENTISVKDDKFYINDEEVSEEEFDEEFTRMKEENIKLN